MISPSGSRRRVQGEMAPLLADGDGEREDENSKIRQQEDRVIEMEKDFIVEELEDTDALICDSFESGKFAYSTLAVAAVFFFPAIGGLLYGYDIGATSAALPALQSPYVSGVSWFNVIADSSALQGLITASAVLGKLCYVLLLLSLPLSCMRWTTTLPLIVVHFLTFCRFIIFLFLPEGAILGSLVCFRVEMWLGRRRELILASLLYFIGALLEVLAGITGKLAIYIHIYRERYLLPVKHPKHPVDLLAFLFSHIHSKAGRRQLVSQF